MITFHDHVDVVIPFPHGADRNAATVSHGKRCLQCGIANTHARGLFLVQCDTCGCQRLVEIRTDKI